MVAGDASLEAWAVVLLLSGGAFPGDTGLCSSEITKGAYAPGAMAARPTSAVPQEARADFARRVKLTAFRQASSVGVWEIAKQRGKKRSRSG